MEHSRASFRQVAARSYWLADTKSSSCTCIILGCTVHCIYLPLFHLSWHRQYLKTHFGTLIYTVTKGYQLPNSHIIMCTIVLHTCMHTYSNHHDKNIGIYPWQFLTTFSRVLVGFSKIKLMVCVFYGIFTLH